MKRLGLIIIIQFTIAISFAQTDAIAAFDLYDFRLNKEINLQEHLSQKEYNIVFIFFAKLFPEFDKIKEFPNLKAENISINAITVGEIPFANKTQFAKYINNIDEDVHVYTDKTNKKILPFLQKLDSVRFRNTNDNNTALYFVADKKGKVLYWDAQKTMMGMNSGADLRKIDQFIQNSTSRNNPTGAGSTNLEESSDYINLENPKIEQPSFSPLDMNQLFEYYDYTIILTANDTFGNTEGSSIEKQNFMIRNLEYGLKELSDDIQYLDDKKIRVIIILFEDYIVDNDKYEIHKRIKSRLSYSTHHKFKHSNGKLNMIVGILGYGKTYEDYFPKMFRSYMTNNGFYNPYDFNIIDKKEYSDLSDFKVNDIMLLNNEGKILFNAPLQFMRRSGYSDIKKMMEAIIKN